MTLAEFKYHSIRHNLTVARKLIIQLVHINNHLVDTFICSWLSPYFVIGIFIFKKKNTFSEYGVSFISTRHTLNLFHGRLLFLRGLRKSSPTFASLIDKITLCLHMKATNVFETELYVDQINISHLRNQSTLTWIRWTRINLCL